MAAVLFRSCGVFRGKVFMHPRWLSFQDLGVHESVIERLRGQAIVKPTEIQSKALVSVREGRNTVINAETGSGKTLCYLIPIINKLITEPDILNKTPYAVILLPTVELCYQVADVFHSLIGSNIKANIVHRDSKLLINHPVVMAIPGTLLNYRLENLSNVKIVVTDEADFLTTSGGKDVWKVLNFLKYGEHQKKRKTNADKKRKNEVTLQEEYKAFLKEKPYRDFPERQFIFVAATLPARGKKSSYNVFKRWLHKPDFVTTSGIHKKIASVEMEYVSLEESSKLAFLIKRIHQIFSERQRKDGVVPGMYERSKDLASTQKGYVRILIFSRTAKRASQVYSFLLEKAPTEDIAFIANSQNIDSNDTGNNESSSEVLHCLSKGKIALLHGGVDIGIRLQSIENFKSGQLQILVCTDIASRGLDIPDVSHVIQFDFATDAAQMLHRVGRTARVGSHGKVLNFVTKDDEDLARVLRTCDDADTRTYEAVFSRNRMFRRRVKGDQAAKLESVSDR